MSINWNDPEMNLEGLRVYYRQALQGTFSSAHFAQIAMTWAEKADAEIERLEGEDSVEPSPLAIPYRRELAEKILLELLRLTAIPRSMEDASTYVSSEGARLAWIIADAFIAAENKS
jgi:hypothetical protein